MSIDVGPWVWRLRFGFLPRRCRLVVANQSDLIVIRREWEGEQGYDCEPQNFFRAQLARWWDARSTWR